jgi:hypothetical protein
MKPGELLDSLIDTLNRPWNARATGAIMAAMGVQQAARIVATLAAPEAVADYVHTVMRGEQTLSRWRFYCTQIGGLVPLFFMLAAHYLTDSGGGWWTVGAQLAWIVLWIAYGQPWLFVTMDEQQLDMRAQALSALCATCSPTQEQLNAASERMGLGRWTTHNPHDDEQI